MDRSSFQTEPSLKRDLKTKGSFDPKPLRRVWIAKDAKGKQLRPLGIPAVRDRVAQEVIRRLLEPIFEPLFHDCSFGFRPSRSCHDAIERLLSFHEEGDRVTLAADIAGFFDNIPHKLIVAAVQSVMTELGLSLGAEKTKIASYGKGYDFLGFRLSSQSRTMRPKSEEKFKTKIREITRRHHNLDARVIERLNQVIRGTANYFATEFSTCVKLFQKLDRWIRMRVRSMKFKRKLSFDNYRMKKRYFDKKLGLLQLLDFTQTTMSKTVR